MYILVDKDGKLSLQEGDNFGEFSIVDESSGQASNSLVALAEPEGEDHYWLDANAVIELSGRESDQQWVDAFWEMLRKVEAYGYSDMNKQQVKAHLVRR